MVSPRGPIWPFLSCLGVHFGHLFGVDLGRGGEEMVGQLSLENTSKNDFSDDGPSLLERPFVETEKRNYHMGVYFFRGPLLGAILMCIFGLFWTTF